MTAIFIEKTTRLGQMYDQFVRILLRHRMKCLKQK